MTSERVAKFFPVIRSAAMITTGSNRNSNIFLISFFQFSFIILYLFNIVNLYFFSKIFLIKNFLVVFEQVFENQSIINVDNKKFVTALIIVIYRIRLPMLKYAKLYINLDAM